MLLQKLDVPIVMPHTMAFVVNRARLSQFRQALRVVLEDGTIKPWLEFCEARRSAFVDQWNQAEVVLDVAQIRQWHATARQSDPSLPKRGFVTVLAHRYHTLVERLDGLAGREGWALAALNGLRNSDDDETLELAEPKDVAWVRNLRFAVSNSRSSRNVLDPVNDLSMGVPPALHHQGHMSPLEVLQLARNQLCTARVASLLCEPFSQSIGPGPFLPPPANAQSLQDPEWPVLPLFAVTHPHWPLVGGHMLGGKALLEAEAMVRYAAPTREWHKMLSSSTRVDDRRWEELVDTHWVRCRDRFADRLNRAYREHDAVLMFENNRSDAFWIGPDWPSVVNESGYNHNALPLNLASASPGSSIR